MASTRISYEQLAASVSEMRAITTRMSGILANIQAQSGPINSAWNSPAGNRYVEKLNQLTGNFEAVNQEMLNSIQYLENTQENYRAVDQVAQQPLIPGTGSNQSVPGFLTE